MGSVAIGITSFIPQDCELIDLSILTPAQFENLSLDLMQMLGLKNCVWRTPGRDGGRDIQGEFFGSDFSGYIRHESWYVECKRHSDTVNWPTVWEKIAYAESNCADILLIVTSSTLSPQAVDEVNKWNDSRRQPHIRFWNGQELKDRLRLFPQILVKYGLSPDPKLDSAVSILPLTKILLKYSNTASSYTEFGKDATRLYGAIHTLSELISARLEEVETTNATRTAPFLAGRDGFDWLAGGQVVEERRADRYTVRAILNLIHCHSPNDSLAVELHEGDIRVIGEEIHNDSYLADLQTIAFWGSMKIKATDSHISMEVQCG